MGRCAQKQHRVNGEGGGGGGGLWQKRGRLWQPCYCRKEGWNWGKLTKGTSILYQLLLNWPLMTMRKMMIWLITGVSFGLCGVGCLVGHIFKESLQ